MRFLSRCRIREGSIAFNEQRLGFCDQEFELFLALVEYLDSLL